MIAETLAWRDWRPQSTNDALPWRHHVRYFAARSCLTWLTSPVDQWLFGWGLSREVLYCNRQWTGTSKTAGCSASSIHQSTHRHRLGYKRRQHSLYRRTSWIIRDDDPTLAPCFVFGVDFKVIGWKFSQTCGNEGPVVESNCRWWHWWELLRFHGPRKARTL